MLQLYKIKNFRYNFTYIIYTLYVNPPYYFINYYSNKDILINKSHFFRKKQNHCLISGCHRHKEQGIN